MGERAVLQIEIDANGVVTGTQKAVRSIDDIKRSAGGLDRTVAGASASLAKFGAAAALAAVAGGVLLLRGLVGVMRDVVKEASDDANALAQLQAVVKSTGGTAGLTAKEMSDMAGSLQLVSKFGDDSIASMMAVLATFTSIRGPAFTETTGAILDMATALGLDLQQAAIQVGKAMNDPVRGLQLLGRVGVSFTDGQKDMVKELVRTGDTLGAQRIILAELNKEFGGSAAAAVGTYTGQVDQLNKRWEIFKEQIGNRLLPILTNLVTRLVNLASGHEELGQKVADVVVYMVRLGLTMAALTASGTDLALTIGAKLNRAYATLADTLAGLTFGETSKQFAEAAKNAAWNADVMETVATASGDLSVELLKAAIGLGEVSTSGGEAARAVGDVGEAAGASAADVAKFAASVQAILDEVNPASAAIRELREKIEIMQTAIATGSRDKLPTYIAALRELQAQLHAVYTEAALVANTIPLIEMPDRPLVAPMPPEPLTGGTMTISQPGVSQYERDMDDANERIAAGLQDSFSSAMTAAIMDFATGGDDVMKKLGESLKAALLDAAAQYLKAMIDAAMRTKAVEAGGSGTGTGTGGLGGMGGGAMGAAGSVLMAAAAVYMVYSITDAIKKANDAGKFKETAVAGVYRGGVGSSYAGELSEQGRAMAASMRDFLNLMQSVAGEWITELPEIGVRVSGDGKKFLAMVGGEIVGTYASMSEAMARGFQAAFSEASFSEAINPIIRDMVTNFRGSDIEELKAGLLQVRGMLDEVSGLSDIEITIRDLPFQADALKQKMVQLGASFVDASNLAAKWQATQMQGIRDQITGHVQTVAEQRAQKEREALMFNAQLALNKSEIEMKRTKLRADIEILKAGGSLNQVDLNLTTQYLGQLGRLTDVKAQLANQDLQIQQGHVNLMTEAGRAALAALELQLSALDQVYAILDSIKPIDLQEIRIPGVGGGGGGNLDTGPSEEQQRAESFLAFLEELRLDGLADYERAVADLNARLAEQAEAADEAAGGEEALARARREGMAQLREDLIDSLGLPLEAVRDRVAGVAAKMRSFYLSNVELQRQFDAGEISQEEFAAAVARSRSVMAEFAEMMRGELMGLALYFTDALGDTEESARIRAELAQMEWDFKRAELRMMIEAVRAIPNALTDDEYQHWLDFLNNLPSDAPAPPAPPPPPDDDSGDDGTSAIEAARARREQALISALDRLRGAADRYREFRENMAVSELSGQTLQQRTAAAWDQLQAAIAQAQAGNLDAIDAVPDLANQYLQILGQFIDPSSAQYQQMRDAILAAMSGIEGGIEGVLNGAVNPQAEVVEGLDTIADILNEIRVLWGGNPVWTPGAGLATLHAGPGRNAGVGAQIARNSSGAMLVSDPQAAESIARMEDRLAQRIDQGFARMTSATSRQTAYAKARDLRSPARGRAITEEGDRIAS